MTCNKHGYRASSAEVTMICRRAQLPEEYYRSSSLEMSTYFRIFFSYGCMHP